MRSQSRTYRAMLLAYARTPEKSSCGTKRFQYPFSEHLTLAYPPRGLAAVSATIAQPHLTHCEATCRYSSSRNSRSDSCYVAPFAAAATSLSPKEKFTCIPQYAIRRLPYFAAR